MSAILSRLLPRGPTYERLSEVPEREALRADMSADRGAVPDQFIAGIAANRRGAPALIELHKKPIGSAII